jgi:hypothetical protein
MPQVGCCGAELKPMARVLPMDSRSRVVVEPDDACLAESVWSRLLERMQSHGAPACSEAHLERVRKAIALGQFHVNSRSLADRLIERLLQA